MRPVPAPTERSRSKPLPSGVDHVGERRRHQHEQSRDDARDEDVVAFGGIAPDEAPVKVVDQIGGAPVQVCRDGGYISGQQARHHEAEEPRREKSEHRGVGHVVPNQTRFHVREGVLQIGQGGEHEERTEADDDPGPGTEGVMGDVEEERAGQRIPLRAGGEHALGDVAAAAGFGAGIPYGPPLDGEWDDQHGESEPPIGEIGQQIEGGGFEAGEQAVESADFGVFEGEPRGGDRPGHGDSELDEVGDQDAPETRGGGEKDT